MSNFQPDRPLMVMEFWPGWFDHWKEKHKVMKTEKVVGIVRDILKEKASINFYMFHGMVLNVLQRWSYTERA